MHFTIRPAQLIATWKLLLCCCSCFVIISDTVRLGASYVATLCLCAACEYCPFLSSTRRIEGSSTSLENLEFSGDFKNPGNVNMHASS